MSYYYDDEYLEIFGGDESMFEKVATIIQKDIFDPLEKSPCRHKLLEKYPNNEGYCLDCGMVISNIDNFMKTNKKSKIKKKCQHENTYEDDNGLYLCKDCKEEIQNANRHSVQK